MTENERFRTALAATLRAEKAARGMTDAQLAEVADVHANSIAAYMNARADVKMATFRLLATALGLTAGELMDRVEARMGDV
jgi:transcriptional regulator with XRE-family HTH domain